MSMAELLSQVQSHTCLKLPFAIARWCSIRVDIYKTHLVSNLFLRLSVSRIFLKIWISNYFMKPYRCMEIVWCLKIYYILRCFYVFSIFIINTPMALGALAPLCLLIVKKLTNVPYRYRLTKKGNTVGSYIIPSSST